ncbi:RagB/SusD family nutrient uptake outer membrane protein [Maribellus comscasis]|uniref:RagB/SusD family nutrient uptake outer membrane protein n=1 Tax=Maribellus comscasis TaxID=2681766 RepID=A0A6I6JQL1_9BACT|nr:RagB/SusD family nutrient uptake outer membrane protein [Maribellus comscasis]QGY43320.1 RagB/SusD family nutrient uptake outer membrane protein [Maribellus comscasis]
MKNKYFELIINYRNTVKKFLLLLVVFNLISCNENDFLEEKPLDFLSPVNSFVTFEHYDAAVIGLYTKFRNEFYGSTNALVAPRVMMQATDLVFYNHDAGANTDFASLLNPNSDFVYNALWGPAYAIIYDANVIIGRAQSEENELTEEQKNKVLAEAYFFRGYMHKMLADLYGGVPIVLQETVEPKRDYVRASRDEVYQQSVTDLLFATENLSDIESVDDYRISDLVAWQVLSEVYISLKQWDKAIEAASKVIDSPATTLMTGRFGTRVNDAFNPDMPWASGGDVYWDLFRKGNQNRSSGNTEALWVLPYEYNIDGGEPGGVPLEVNFCPRIWQVTIPNSDGTNAKLIPTPNTYYGGRPGGKCRLTEYFYHTIWDESGYQEDIRNASYNIIRDVKVNNPASEYNGQWVMADNVPIPLKTWNDTVRNFFPIPAKAASMGDHPDDLWIADQTVPGSITSITGPSGKTYRNEYKMRLAETYLLRAEAYLGKGDKSSAADDINVVRSRANAPDVSSADVDIDYILDERMRELYVEEFRLLTLTRLGKLVERTKLANPVVGNTYGEYQNLWPIPYSEIEKNTGAVLEQNPGY